MENQDIRWKHRFQNFESAFLLLKEGVEMYAHTDQNLIKEGIVKRFEFTHELAWKVMKDFLTYEGIKDIIGSRSATREAYNKGLIKDGEQWMNMLETRNQTVHTYQRSILEQEFHDIVVVYFPLIDAFYKRMKDFL